MSENPYAGQGSVLLDIGDDVGALVVSMPEETLGVEVEVRPAGRRRTGHRPHVAVVARPVGAGTVPSLVFPALAAGRYELCDKGTDRVRLRAVVHGGRVTVLRWAGGSAAPSADPAGAG
ncbi:MAG: hypothetical protein HOQ22_03965 [Nocardioidaceae bacterium]|nr:hypothetical protein [Nocardioidaceae bacterium]NUS50181.1 hypothetical protein [Nocardioidaceae bacterium]